MLSRHQPLPCCVHGGERTLPAPLRDAYHARLGGRARRRAASGCPHARLRPARRRRSLFWPSVRRGRASVEPGAARLKPLALALHLLVT